MLNEFFLDIVFSLVTMFLDSFSPFGINNISWSVSAIELSPFFTIVRSICYFLPVSTIAAIIRLIFLFGVFRIAVRLIKTIWDLLPFV